MSGVGGVVLRWGRVMALSWLFGDCPCPVSNNDVLCSDAIPSHTLPDYLIEVVIIVIVIVIVPVLHSPYHFTSWT